MWQPLFANLAVIGIILFVWSSVAGLLGGLGRKRRRMLFGGAMGVATLGSMMMSFQALPGVFYDLRAPLIVISCFFGGLPAAIVTGLAAAAYRIWLGGAVSPGLTGILLAVAVGLAGHVLVRHRRATLTDLTMLAAAVAVSMVLAAAALPAELRAETMPLLRAPVSLSFIATLLLGGLLIQDERRRELAATNRRYRAMVEAFPDPLNVKDLEGRFLAANPATATLMRAESTEALLGKTDFDFYPAGLARTFREDELVVLRNGKHSAIEQAGLLPDGSNGWLSTMKAPLLDASGEIVGLITHNRDITQSVLLQAKLDQTQARLDQALDSMTDGLAMYDRDGTVLFCNNRYRELFPRTAHLRVPGGTFATIIGEMIALGEERLAPGESVEEHVASKCAELRRDGEEVVEFADGRVFAASTKLLPDGNALRMMSDITARRSFEKNLEHLALHDTLTGLPNRAFFNRELERLLTKAAGEGGELVVMLLDLDRFKAVNDTFGHPAGDALLVAVARRLEAAIRRGDFAARLGGDEFAILMHGSGATSGATSLARRVINSLSRPLDHDGVTLLPGGTIGYTIFPNDRSDAEGLLKNADRALYRAKSSGRGTWKAFDPAEFDGRTALAG